MTNIDYVLIYFQLDLNELNEPYIIRVQEPIRINDNLTLSIKNSGSAITISTSIQSYYYYNGNWNINKNIMIRNSTVLYADNVTIYVGLFQYFNSLPQIVKTFLDIYEQCQQSALSKFKIVINYYNTTLQQENQQFNQKIDSNSRQTNSSKFNKTKNQIIRSITPKILTNMKSHKKDCCKKIQQQILQPVKIVKIPIQEKILSFSDDFSVLTTDQQETQKYFLLSQVQEDDCNMQISNELQKRNYILSCDSNCIYSQNCLVFSINLKNDIKFILTDCEFQDAEVQNNSVLRLFLNNFDADIQYCVVNIENNKSQYINTITLFGLFRELPILNKKLQQLSVKLEQKDVQFVLYSDYVQYYLENDNKSRSSRVIPQQLTEVMQILLSIEIVIATKKKYQFFMSDELINKYGKWLRQRLSGRLLVKHINQIDTKYNIYYLESLSALLQYKLNFNNQDTL